MLDVHGQVRNVPRSSRVLPARRVPQDATLVAGQLAAVESVDVIRAHDSTLMQSGHTGRTTYNVAVTVENN